MPIALTEMQPQPASTHFNSEFNPFPDCGSDSCRLPECTKISYPHSSVPNCSPSSYCCTESTANPNCSKAHRSCQEPTSVQASGCSSKSCCTPVKESDCSTPSIGDCSVSKVQVACSALLTKETSPANPDCCSSNSCVPSKQEISPSCSEKCSLQPQLISDSGQTESCPSGSRDSANHCLSGTSGNLVAKSSCCSTNSQSAPKKVESCTEASRKCRDNCCGDEAVEESLNKGMTPSQAVPNLGKACTALNVAGLCCPSEAALIRRILEPMPGVADVQIDIVNKRSMVSHDPAIVSDIQLVKALNEASLEASIHKRGESKSSRSIPSWWTVLAGIFLLISLFRYLYSPLEYVALGSLLCCGPKILLKATKALLRFTVDINLLMSLAAIGAVAIGDYPEAATVVFLFSIADWLEYKSTEKARAAMADVVSLSPETATIESSGQQVAVESVGIGTVLAVKPGEIVPIDGVVEAGMSSVDEGCITGESVPLKKGKNDQVFAGSINKNGYFSVRTTALSADSAIARLVKLVSEAQSQRSRGEQIVETFAKYYTPLVIVAAALLVILPYSLSLPNARSYLYNALVLVVVGCPCSLVISTPVTMTCGITQAARFGVLIKGGAHLEMLGRLKNIAFDKTGTLTEGLFRVTEFVKLEESASMERILLLLASVECQSTHPMADAIVRYCRINGVGQLLSGTEFAMVEGEGVRAVVDGDRVEIGNLRMADRLGMSDFEARAVCARWTANGSTVSFVFVGRRLLAVFCLRDQVRSHVTEAIASLAARGVRCAMLTGDNSGTAAVVRNAIDSPYLLADDVFAELLPDDKVSVLRDLKNRFKFVGFVGDGVNDAPVLAAADVGVAMGVAGTAAAMEAADVALMTNDVRHVARAVRLGRLCRGKVLQNIALSVVSKGIVLGFLVVGRATLWAAIVADVGTTLVVIANSMTVLEGRKRKPSMHEPKCWDQQDCAASTLGATKEGDCCGQEMSHC